MILLPIPLSPCGEHQPADHREEAAEDGLIFGNASIFYNGRPVHVNRATEGLSTHDITTVNSNWATKGEWIVGKYTFVVSISKLRNHILFKQMISLSNISS